ncbi:MAG: type II secretion system protein [Clostridia bacterium]|nr:type II secretion system protein [Clostridia bacterium]
MRNTKKGFTLVELLVVIAILAVLATVSVVGYTSFIDRANQSTALQEMTQIRDSVIAEDILNPNFSISGGTITVADDTDSSYPNFNEYVKSLTDALGEGRSCDNLETGAAALVLKNTDKKVKATWTFADNTIETDKLGNDEPVAPPAGGEGGEPACAHTNTTTTTTATCEEDGTKTVHCDDCNTDISTEADSAKGHSFNDAKECTVCGAKIEWVLVTDASTLKVGDRVIIVSSGEYNYALSTNQKSNNRGQAAVTKSDNSVVFNDDVQILILESGASAGTFAFNTGDGYLYAASTSSNYLRTQDAINENASWVISTADGKTTITAQGSSTHNTLMYNTNSSLFSAYLPSQTNDVVEITVYVESIPKHNCEDYAETVAGVDVTCEADGLTNGSICGFCDKVLVEQEVIITEGHSYNNGVCSKCGNAELTPKTYSYTFGEKQFSANGSKTLNGVSWTLSGDGGYWGYDNAKGQQFGSGSNPYKTLTLKSASINNVSEITINTSGASSVNASFVVKVNGIQVGSVTNVTTTATSYTFTLDTATTGEIEIVYTQTSSKALYVKSITVEYAE